MEDYHIPVLLKEAIDGLSLKPGKKYIDTTLGGSGHTKEILKRGGKVLGIDQDPEALKNAEENFNLKLARGNFANLKRLAKENGFEKVSGILFDLGVSSHQLETDYRGFSFNTDAPLDMRMDPDLAVTAADLINGLNEGELYELFNKYAEEHHSRTIARAVVRARSVKPITKCNELAEVVLRVRRRGEGDRTHPATRIFQALRMAVNDELNSLKSALPQAEEILEKSGRLVVISFHSLEDRIVKDFLREESQKGLLKIITDKPITPSEEEVKENSRSRSAKLRIAEKI